jgi:hypothetical protein
VELSSQRTDIHTAEESEFLSDPIVALSVRIVTATLSPRTCCSVNPSRYANGTSGRHNFSNCCRLSHEEP